MQAIDDVRKRFSKVLRRLLPERGSALSRWADKIVGVPVCFLLGLFRRRQSPLSAPPRRIGLLISAAIGDTIICQPAWKAVRETWPEAELVFFVGPSNRGIMPLLDGYDRLVVLPVKNPFAAIPLLRAEAPFDLWIDFGQWPRINAFYTYVVRARFKVGFRTPGQARHYVYDRAVLHSREIHEIENFRNLVRAAGAALPEGASAPGDWPKIDVDLKPGAEDRDPRRVILHLLTGGYRAYLKQWPEERWLRVVDHLLERDRIVCFTGGPEDRAAIDALIAKAGKPLGDPRLRNMAGALSLAETARLIGGAALVVSVNTGILHLAAALGRPIVAIQGPTSSIRWGALSPVAVAVESPLPCAPCLNLGFDYGCPVPNCMRSISVEAVLAEVDRVLDARG